MKIIYKYEIDLRGNTFLPEEAEILKIAPQGGDLYLWALVSPSETPTRDVSYHIYGTGQGIHDEDLTYVDTVFMDTGIVWHIFKEV